MPDVLVIGAGPAGIASAYALQQAGVSYVVYDRASVIASTWHSLYPSLRLNTSRFFSHMPGMRFPLSWGIFPTGRQYYDYLLQYTRLHRFNIHLGVTVQRVAPAEGLWRVESTRGTEHFRAVISATGVYGRPVMPQIEGMQAYSGRLLHAQDFRHPHQVTGEDVLVVGNGPSGIDIAVASSATARSVRLAMRSGVTLRRRYPYGLPHHGWMLVGGLLPKSWCARLLRWAGRADYGDVSRYGLPKPRGAGSITAYQGPELLRAVRDGSVKPVSAPVCFAGREVVLADGTRLAPDTVIMATGYEPVLHEYLDIPMQFSDVYFEPGAPCEWQVGPNGQRGFPMLDRSQHPNGRQVLGHRGLYLVGVWYKGKGAMYNMNEEARIAARQIVAQLQ